MSAATPAINATLLAENIPREPCFDGGWGARFLKQTGRPSRLSSGLRIPPFCCVARRAHGMQPRSQVPPSELLLEISRTGPEACQPAPVVEERWPGGLAVWHAVQGRGEGLPSPDAARATPLQRGVCGWPPRPPGLLAARRPRRLPLRERLQPLRTRYAKSEGYTYVTV